MASSYKIITQELERRIATGESRSHIYGQLSQKYDKRVVATLLANIADPTLKSQYAKLNQIVVVLLWVLAIIKSISAIMVSMLLGSWSLRIGALIVPLVPILFAFEIRKFHGYVYRVLGFLALAALLNELTDLVQLTGWTWLTSLGLGVEGAVLFVIIISSFRLTRMFPDLTFRGPRKDKKTNEYLFVN